MDLTFLGWRKLYRHTRSLQHSSEEPITLLDGGLVEAAPANATLVGSLSEKGENTHLPVLDIDYSAVMLQSSTPGHFHLYLNKAVPWDKYVAVMRAMADAGLLEQGFVDCSIQRGQSFVRMPGVKKGEDLSAEERAQLAAATLDDDPVDELTLTPRTRASERQASRQPGLGERLIPGDINQMRQAEGLQPLPEGTVQRIDHESREETFDRIFGPERPRIPGYGH